jgi:hypothetical protein
MTKLAIICPDRGDRPLFRQNIEKTIERQTFQPQEILFVDYAPESHAVDITQRYHRGYNQLRGKNLDLIAFIEVDDCYRPNYLEFMLKEWERVGKPDLFGTNKTFYYHIKLFKWFTMEHYQRSSMMNTFLKPDLNFPWCSDNVAYTDMHLWDNCQQLSRKLISPDPLLSLGIKHGIGECGGFAHRNKLDLYDGPRSGKDPDREFLRSIAGESFEFFANYPWPS